MYSTIQHDNPIRIKARHRETLPCPKDISLARGVELYTLTRSVTTWLIAPSATTYNGSNQDSETGQKIVIGGVLHQKTLSDPVFGYQVLNLWAGGHSHMAQTVRIGTCVNPECEAC